jgi:hypothetical protein
MFNGRTPAASTVTLVTDELLLNETLLPTMNSEPQPYQLEHVE